MPAAVNDQALDQVKGAYDRQIEGALQNSLDGRREGMSEEAVLTETAIAVNTARALQLMTGQGWERHLAGRADEVAQREKPSRSRGRRRRRSS